MQRQEYQGASGYVSVELWDCLNLHLKAVGNSRTTAALIDLNGPPASEATKTTNNNISVNRTVKQSITGRVPEAEPWGGHTEQQTKIASAASSDLNLSGKDIDVASIQNNNQSAPNNPKSSTTQTGGYEKPNRNTNPRNGSAF